MWNPSFSLYYISSLFTPKSRVTCGVVSAGVCLTVGYLEWEGHRGMDQPKQPPAGHNFHPGYAL